MADGIVSSFNEVSVSSADEPAACDILTSRPDDNAISSDAREPRHIGFAKELLVGVDVDALLAVDLSGVMAKYVGYVRDERDDAKLAMSLADITARSVI